MKFDPKCLTCFVDDITGALAMLKVPPVETLSILQESLTYLSEHIKDDLPPSYYITGLHRILKQRLNLDIPFEDVRATCLASGMAVAAMVEKKAEALAGIDKFRFLVRWTVAANSLDFRTAGAGYDLSPASVEKTLEGYFEKGLGLDQSEKIYSAALAAKNIVYVPDNVGELPFDKLLVKLLSSYGAKVTVPMRGGAITSDAIWADAEKVDMASVAARVILAGPDTLGISFSEMSADLSQALAKADLVIAKGQANYYVLSEFGNRYPHATIACLLTAKCGLVWQDFNCTGKASVAAVIKKPSQQ